MLFFVLCSILLDLTEAVCRLYNNAYYAKVGGISTEEMNGLEMKFLFSLDFRLHVTTEVFNKYCSKIKRECDVNHQTDQ